MLKKKLLGMALSLSIAFTSLFSLNVAPAQAAYDPGVGWNVVWQDEFNGTALDTNKWVYETGTGSGGWGNNELQYYTNRTNNVAVSGGALQIKALREAYGGMSFTSGRIKTQGKYSVKYGKIAASIKLPEGKGMWPAFWMLGDNIGSVGWPKCGEIDIMEMAGGQNDYMTYATCHWDNAGAYANYGKTYTNSAKLSGGYHIYEVEWDANYIRARFDGIEYYVIDITPAELSEFRSNFFILLNLAVGGKFFSPAITNPADVTAALPQTMSVDWVRVYSKGTSGSTTVTDPLNDWSKSIAHTGNWVIDASNAAAYFNGDAARATRTADTAQSITYNLSNMKSFNAKVYYYQYLNAGSVKFFASGNNSTWTQVGTTNTAGVASGGSWYYTNFTPTSLPAGTNYVKVEFSNDNRVWAPQLAQFTFSN